MSRGRRRSRGSDRNSHTSPSPVRQRFDSGLDPGGGHQGRGQQNLVERDQENRANDDGKDGVSSTECFGGNTPDIGGSVGFLFSYDIK